MIDFKGGFMSISMYKASVPVFIRMLGNLSKILKKGVAHAKAKDADADALAGCRLHFDMFDLVRQIQVASDAAKGAAARLAGVEPPVFEDKEKTMAELIARVDKTIAYLKTVKPRQIDGSETRPVVLTFPGATIKYEGLPYLLEFAMPNFFFHVTTAYNILRHNGVGVGKMDYIGDVPMATPAAGAKKKTAAKKKAARKRAA
jgi:hypothetical protein